jgi:tetratricopeptide (TPR) repeat protein
MRLSLLMGILLGIGILASGWSGAQTIPLPSRTPTPNDLTATPTPNDSTLLAQTLQPLIDARFTQTAQYTAQIATQEAILQGTRDAASTYMFELTSTGEAIMRVEQLAETAFFDSLTATATQFTLTPTPPPSPTFTSDLPFRALPTPLPTDIAQFVFSGYDELYWDRLGSAELMFRAAIGQDNRITEAHYGLGIIYNHRQLPFESMMSLVQASQTGTTDPNLWFLLAQAQYRRGDYHSATHDIRQALALKPAYAPYHLLAAAIARQTFEDETAINHYLAAIELNQDVDTILSFAFFLEDLRDRNPNSTEYNTPAGFYRALGLGILYTNTYRHTDALNQYTIALEILGADGRLEPVRGQFRTLNDRLPEARVYYHRAKLHTFSGNDQAADSDLERALALDPHFGYALHSRAGRVLTGTANLDTFHALLRQASDTRPDNPDLQWMILNEHIRTADQRPIPTDLIVRYLHASATRHITLPALTYQALGSPYSEVYVPYIENGWVYVAQLPPASAGERMRVTIETIWQFPEPETVFVFIDATGQIVGHNLPINDPTRLPWGELTVGNQPIFVMVGFKHTGRAKPLHKDVDFSQMWIRAERLPLVPLPEITDEAVPPTPPPPSATPMPTFTPTLAP